MKSRCPTVNRQASTAIGSTVTLLKTLLLAEPLKQRLRNCREVQVPGSSSNGTEKLKKAKLSLLGQMETSLVCEKVD